MTIFSYIFYFVILISVLVLIHEGGHFAIAKLFKVKVHVFSLGFGPRLFGFKKGDTDYRISALPMGGYVRMLGEDPSVDVPEEDKGKALTDKPLWQRFLIIVAGPAMNLIFPVILFFVMGFSQDTLIPAEIGQVVSNTPAAASELMPGDRVIEIDGQPILTFDELVQAVKPNPGRPLSFKIQRGDRIVSTTIKPSAKDVPKYPGIPPLAFERETVGRIGAVNAYLPPLLGIFDPNGAAAGAGLRTFDSVRSVNGKEITRYMDLEQALLESRGKTATLVVQPILEEIASYFPSIEQRQKIMKDSGGKDAKKRKSPFGKKRTVKLAIPRDLTAVSTLGLEQAERYVVHITPDGAAAEAGLRPGDKIVGIDGNRDNIYTIETTIYDSCKGTKDNRQHQLTWMRDGEEITRPYAARFIPAGTAQKLGVANDIKDRGYYRYVPVNLWEAPADEWRMVPPTPVANTSPVKYAWRFARQMTLELSTTILAALKGLVLGKISFMSVGGPLEIGKMAGDAGQQGPGMFFWFMGFVSLNLGLLNLLPIPVLDGGQIAIIGSEAIMRRPLSNTAKERIMLLGLVMVLFLMVWAVIMDIARRFVG